MKHSCFFLSILSAFIILTAGCNNASLPQRESDLSLPPNLFIAHALGGNNNDTYTNSLEAFELHYGRGRRWFEVDLALTFDKKLVCFHEGLEETFGFSKQINQISTQEFLRQRLQDRYTPVSFDQLLQLLKDRGDFYIVIDTKRWTRAVTNALGEALGRLPQELREKIVPQFYRPADLKALSGLEHLSGRFTRRIFTLYQTSMSDRAVLTFVNRYRIRTVTVSTERFSASLAENVHRLGAAILVHTVNDPERIDEFTKAGADGFYTDFYYPADQPEVF